MGATRSGSRRGGAASRRVAWHLGVAVFLSASLGLASGCSSPGESDPFATLPGAVYDPPRPAAALRLTGGDGATFDLARERGHVVLIFFGFTHCPDVCPETMSQWARVHATLGADTSDVRFVFVTVDPDRDTPAVADAYARRFAPSFRGLSGTRADVGETVRAWGAAPGVPAGPDDPPTHSAQVFVVDRAGFLRWGYGRSVSDEDIVRGVRTVASLESRR